MEFKMGKDKDLDVDENKRILTIDDKILSFSKIKECDIGQLQDVITKYKAVERGDYE
jgi:hypothetical protein